MSWGERSCMNIGGCNHNPTFETCNVDCEGYASNGRQPDSVSRRRGGSETLRACRYYRAGFISCKAGIDFARVPVGTCDGLGDCRDYRPFTPEEIAAQEAKANAAPRDILTTSACCEAPLDERQVIKDGRHAGHGPRYCSACGKLAYIV